jgi:superfamily I DNA/RNA helicase
MDCIEGITPKCKENDEEDAEELRCMYVACTRAKEELYVLVPKYYNMRNIRGYISHFVNKIDILKTMRRNVGDSELLRLMQRPVYDF